MNGSRRTTCDGADCWCNCLIIDRYRVNARIFEEETNILEACRKYFKYFADCQRIQDHRRSSFRFFTQNVFRLGRRRKNFARCEEGVDLFGKSVDSNC